MELQNVDLVSLDLLQPQKGPVSATCADWGGLPMTVGKQRVATVERIGLRAERLAVKSFRSWAPTPSPSARAALEASYGRASVNHVRKVPIVLAPTASSCCLATTLPLTHLGTSTIARRVIVLVGRPELVRKAVMHPRWPVTSARCLEVGPRCPPPQDGLRETGDGPCEPCGETDYVIFASAVLLLIGDLL